MSSETVLCPAGFTYVYGECYQITASSSLTWPGAALACQNQSAYLAAPRSEAEARWLYEVFVTRGQISLEASVWLGISDISEEGVWRSVEDDGSNGGGYGGAPVSFTYWTAGQSDSTNSAENCVMVGAWGKGRWIDILCSTLARGLCKYDATITAKVKGKPSRGCLLFVLLTVACRAAFNLFLFLLSSTSLVRLQQR